MLVDIDWDDADLEHATRRASRAEIEQAISNADRYFRQRTGADDRRAIRSVADGGRSLVIVVQVLGPSRIRPITAWGE